MTKHSAFTLRAATPEDEPFLWRVLTFAASTEGTDADVEAAKTDPLLYAYVKGYGRDGDLGVVALSGDAAVGAAWLRLCEGERHPSKVWTREEPELVIAALPGYRAGGVGSAMLSAIIEAASGRYPAVVLSVREGNPAVRLYERFGFVVERRVVNRVGGVSLAMRRGLPRAGLSGRRPRRAPARRARPHVVSVGRALERNLAGRAHPHTTSFRR